MEQRVRRMFELSGLMWVTCVGWVLYEWWLDPREDLRHPAVMASAWMTVGFWAGTLRNWLRYYRHPFFTHLVIWQFTRLWWALSAGMLWVHMAAAMHAAHGWSLDRAVAHVAAVDGTGAGFWFNLAVAVVWTADAVRLAVWPRSYDEHPYWLNYAVHGLVAFFVFNAAVVFAGDWLHRTAGLVAFGWLGWEWRRGRRYAVRPGPNPTVV